MFAYFALKVFLLSLWAGPARIRYLSERVAVKVPAIIPP